MIGKRATLSIVTSAVGITALTLMQAIPQHALLILIVYLAFAVGAIGGAANERRRR